MRKEAVSPVRGIWKRKICQRRGQQADLLNFFQGLKTGQVFSSINSRRAPLRSCSTKLVE
jgi:hypothetical protein